MDDRLRAQIHNSLNLRETEDLLEIWQTRNLKEWDEETFNIIGGILLDRLGSLPVRPPPVPGTPFMAGEQTARAAGFERPQVLGRSRRGKSVPEWLYLDENSLLLVGWPGHRHRQGRCGYDPLETDFEFAHMQGTIISRLLGRKFRTRNPIYLLLMTFVGLIYSLPLIYAAMIFLESDWSSILILLIFCPYWAVGIALLINVGASLESNGRHRLHRDGSAFF